MKLVLLRRLAISSLLLGLAAVHPLLPGCGGDLVVDMDTPLVITETYPVSGAEVPIEALQHLRVVFSLDLGLRAAASSEVREHFRVEVSSDAQEWTEIPFSAYGYDPEERCFTLDPDGQVLRQLRPRWELRLIVLAGLAAERGAPLPRDRYFFFRLQG